jgi:hypothetical protein
MITKNTADLKKYAHVTSGFTFENMQSFIQDGVSDLLYKYISKSQYIVLEAYTGNDAIILEAKELAAKFEVKFGMFSYLPIGSMQVTSAGIINVTPNQQAATSRTALNDAQRVYKKGALQALDSLLELLEENEANFPSWKASKAYTNYKSLLVNATAVFQSHFDIFNSRQTFISLVPDLKIVESQFIKPGITAAVLAQLKTKPSTDLTAAHLLIFNEVKQKVQAAIVLFTVSKTLGSGMYYQSATGFQIRFDILDFERKFAAQKQIDHHIGSQIAQRKSEANNFLKEALDLIQQNTTIFTTYNLPETVTRSSFIATSGFVGI